MSELKERIYDLASKVRVDEYGQTYVQALREIDDNDETALRVQAAYIAVNAHPMTKAEKEALRELTKIGGSEEDDEIRGERISSSFERFTENKVRGRRDIEDELSRIGSDNVVRCETATKHMIPIKGNACWELDKLDAELFEQLPEDVRYKVLQLARKGIIVTPTVACAVDLSGNGFSSCWAHNRGLDKHCDELPSKEVGNIPEDVKEAMRVFGRCMVKGAIEIYEDYDKSIDKYGFHGDGIGMAEQELKRNEFPFNMPIKVRTKAEKDAELKRLEKELESRKVSMDDFKEFAKAYDEKLNDVLYYQPWVEDALTDDARKKVREIRKRRK